MELMPHIGVLVRAGIMGSVFAGVLSFVSGRPFFLSAVVATAVLFILTEAIFYYANNHNQTLLATARGMQDKIDEE